MYSQNDEERRIADYFGGYVGRFLDIGANDGVTLSNTHALALADWSGVCVEPSPQAFSRLAALYATRPDIVCINAAIGTDSGVMTLHESGEHLGRGDVALLSTLIDAERLRWDREEFNGATVRVMTYAEALGGQKFDFISIDAEGMDLAIFEQINLTEAECGMCIVEVNSGDARPFIAHARKHGMRATHRNAENIIFIR